MLDDAEFNNIVYYGDGRCLHVLWDAWDGWENQTFAERREIFLWILERLLREGRIKLHKKSLFLDTPIEEQLAVFRRAFPESMEDADRLCTKPGYESPYEGFGMNVWWFMDVCPAGVAWRHADGSYVIAD